MGLSGKYSFPGIQKAGAAAINAALASASWGAWLLASPFAPIVKLMEEFAINWLSNKGLIVINIGVFYVEGSFDQTRFDKAMDKAIADSKQPGITDAQKKADDQAVINAFRKFGRITRNN